MQNDELRNSWENLISPGSLSSYFNSEDNVFRWTPPSNTFPINEQLMWSELQSIFPTEISNLSPQTSLQIPGSHSSLQTGLSSSYHCTFAGIPTTEFADLKIFPAWTPPTRPDMPNETSFAGDLGKRKMEELESVVAAAYKGKEKKVEELKPTDLTQPPRPEELEAQGEGKKCKLIDPQLMAKAKSEPQGPPISPSVNLEKSEGKAPQILAPAHLGSRPLDKSLIGPPLRAVGRPPRPKQQVVQTLLCEKKRKFEEFEPIIEAFVSEITLDMHKWITEKRQEILQKFKKFKYMAFFGADGLDTGPN